MKPLPSTLSANIARANFYKILEEAGEDMRQFTIVPRNKPPIVMMSLSEFEGWMETLDIMSDKKMVADIKQGRKELKEGKGISEDEVNKLLGWE